MKKMILVAVIMLSSVAIYAQNEVGQITIQPKVGLNIANSTDIDGTDPRFGIVAGAEFEYGVSDIFSISAGALYSMQGAKNILISHEKYTAKVDYINVPILANVYVLKGLAIKLGVQPGFCINHKLSANGVSVDISDLTDVNTFYFSVPVGASYEYQHFVLDARYNWGITKVVKDFDYKNTVFQFTLGYKFAL